MTRHWDDASAVKSVGFDRATHTLRVQLGSGEVYEFADVPERLYDDFAHAPDRDTYFRQHVCDEFSATRVGDIDLAELANERREDAILGAPLAEHVSIAMSDERERVAHRCRKQLVRRIENPNAPALHPTERVDDELRAHVALESRGLKRRWISRRRGSRNRHDWLINDRFSEWLSGPAVRRSGTASTGGNRSRIEITG